MGETPLQVVGLLVTLAILAGASPVRLLRDARASRWLWPHGTLLVFRPRRWPSGPVGSGRRRSNGAPGAGLYALIGGSTLLGLLFLTLALAIAPG